MKAPSTRIPLAAIAISALFAAPATAAGVEEAVVPPSNSAATQYTETFPTSGGDKKTDQKPSHRAPAKVLGSNNAKKLENEGPEGRAAAKAATATAPTSIAPQPPSSQASGGNDRSKGKGGQGNGEADASGHPSGAASGAGTARPPAAEPAGSSGVGSAIGQATGFSTSGQSGALLLLVILATILWSLFYLWRQRRQVD